MNIKSKREAILEFLRIPLSENDRVDYQYLIDQTYETGSKAV